MAARARFASSDDITRPPPRLLHAWASSDPAVASYYTLSTRERAQHDQRRVAYRRDQWAEPAVPPGVLRHLEVTDASEALRSWEAQRSSRSTLPRPHDDVAPWPHDEMWRRGRDPWRGRQQLRRPSPPSPALLDDYDQREAKFQLRQKQGFSRLASQGAAPTANREWGVVKLEPVGHSAAAEPSWRAHLPRLPSLIESRSVSLLSDSSASSSGQNTPTIAPLRGSVCASYNGELLVERPPFPTAVDALAYRRESPTVDAIPATEPRSVATATAAVHATVGNAKDDSAKKKKRKTRNCTTTGCDKLVVDRGVCIRHGGGKRCNVDGCDCRAQNRGLCWKHGGYTICTVDGCAKRAKSRGFCWSHGGGTQCKTDGCEKIAVSRGRCWAHGGGKRCKIVECRKPAALRMDNYCAEHHAMYSLGDTRQRHRATATNACPLVRRMPIRKPTTVS